MKEKEELIETCDDCGEDYDLNDWVEHECQN